MAYFMWRIVVRGEFFLLSPYLLHSYLPYFRQRRHVGYNMSYIQGSDISPDYNILL